jgi:hypothetical protein
VYLPDYAETGVCVNAVSHYVKRRNPPAPGSITAALDSFRAEVRFYREIAPVVGVRVPEWGSVMTAYGTAAGLADALPAITVQGLLSLADTDAGSAQATAWIRRFDAAADLMKNAL